MNDVYLGGYMLSEPEWNQPEPDDEPRQIRFGRKEEDYGE